MREIDCEIENVREKEIQILKQFDLDYRFGPCYGIPRMERWNWAKSRNLEPPDNVRALIEAKPGDTDYTEG